MIVVGQSPTPFQASVTDRFGVLPNFFCTAAAAPGLIEELWSFARSAYLDSALPSLFKERLFVQLSRFCEIRYCIVRHVGFLVGLGRPAGDANAEPESVDDVIALLSRPIPDASQLAASLSRLQANDSASPMPKSGTQAEKDLFDALTIIFVEPARSARAREAVRTAVGDDVFEMLAAYLAFVRTAHFWTETHPELAYEPDMLELMERRPDLQQILLSPDEAERVRAGGDLRRILSELHQTEAALRESEEKYRSLFESIDEGFCVLEVLYDERGDARDCRYVQVNSAFLKQTGQDDPTGKLGSEYVPASAPMWLATYDAIVRSGEPVRFEQFHPDSGRWYSVYASIIGERGSRLVASVFADVTVRKLAEAALRESEERQRLMVELVPARLWSASPDGQEISLNEGWTAYTGQSVAETQDYGWLAAIHPDDLLATQAAFEHAFATGEPLERQQRIRKGGDGYRWHLVRHVPVRDADGDIARWFGAALEIHELHLLQERQDVMVKELQHRTRNLITVVSSLANQTLSGVTSLADFEEKFRDRLEALFRVQGLLSHVSAGKRVTFDELLGSELAALGAPPGKVTLDGPAGVSLRSAMVQTFALALHELATNALKYGALTAPDGHLSIRWTVIRSSADQPRLQVDWRETGVAMTHVDGRPRGSGYGRQLIEKALPYQLNAKTSYDITLVGVHCTIDVPVSAVVANQE